MAFNYRPKNGSELLKKNKRYSTQAADIHEYINKQYAVSIVLDPGSTFKTIKIPRIVEDSVNITNLKNALKKITNTKELNIEFGNGSGDGGSNINAKETAEQENASRLVCEHYKNKKKIPKMADILAIYNKCDDDWYDTFCKQAKIVSDKLASGNYKFSRDSNTGMMFLIEDLALRQCGVTKKDSWNPADIYAVKDGKQTGIKLVLDKIKASNCDPEVKLDMLNEEMRGWYKSKDLIGISLKKIGKGPAKAEATNTNSIGDLVIKDISISEVNCDLNLDSKGEFETGEMMLKLNVSGKSVTAQIRAFSGGARENTQLDMTETGASAKLGKSSITLAIDPYLKGKRHTRPVQKDLPRVGKWTESDVEKYIEEYESVKNLKIGGNSINWGECDWETTLREAIELEKDNKRTASQLNSKLQAFGWVRVFNQFDRNKLKKFLTILYYGAKKQYASAGPFLKVY